MPLVDVRGFNLGGDAFDNATKGFDVGRKISQFDRESQIRKILSDIQPSQQQTQLAEQTGQFGNENTGIPTQEDKINQVKSIDPTIAKKLLEDLGLTDPLKRAEASRFASQLQNTPFDKRADKINARAQSLQSQGRNNKDTIELLDLNEAEQNQALTGVQLLDLSTKDRLDFGKGLVKGTKERAFDNLIKDFTPEEKESAKRRKAGLEARAVGSAAQTIAEEGKTEEIAQSQARIKSEIMKQVTTAKAKATERGEAFTDLSRAKAALPGLKKAIKQLRDLSVLATNTLGGRAWDTVVKETGFGSTKGATARAKFIATIDNQVLPLLKPTFGAAFTVAEGDSLRATMGDPNSTPAQKMAQLDAFIDQKIRDIETKQNQLEVLDSNIIKPASEMTDEEIQAELAGGQ